MSKHTFHFQVFVPAEFERKAKALRGCKLDFGPHARKRWNEKFGAMSKPKSLPKTAKFIEINVKPTKEGLILDTVLFRFAIDEFTDVVLSVVATTGFVCSAWRVPKWFGLNAGRPNNPEKYLTHDQYLNLTGGSHAA